MVKNMIEKQMAGINAFEKNDVNLFVRLGMVNLLKEKMKEIHVELDERKIKQFYRFYELLIEWNRVMNLTGITEYEEIVEKHFVDSLSIVKVLDLKQVDKILDLGTGAGFPGIPLKIVFPHLNMVLLDSLNKRIKFLDEVIKELELTEIYTIHGRAEDYARKEEYREQFDLCVSRAVANLSSLSEYCLPFVRVGGNFVSYKSGEVEEEVKQAGKAISVLGGKMVKVQKFVLPQTDVSRSFVQIEKKKRTPKSYPRKAGTPSRTPIQ